MGEKNFEVKTWDGQTVTGLDKETVEQVYPEDTKAFDDASCKSIEVTNLSGKTLKITDQDR